MSKPSEGKGERILILEDEKLIRWSLREKLTASGYTVTEAEAGGPAMEFLEKEAFDLLLLDYRLPDTDGLTLLRICRERWPDMLVIMMTAYSSVEGAVTAMRLGAYDYLNKPFKVEEMLHTIRKALETNRLRAEVERLRISLKEKYSDVQMVGDSPALNEVRHLIDRVSKSRSTTILILGESGTGKDLVAKAIHATSDRASHPFMNITCSALPETLLESELMGHEKGAFTDAKSMKKGLFELANEGTVFLDEIGDMGISLQAKLLRFLEEKSFRRVGGTRDIKVNVRIIAATNRNLEEAIREGLFREDLYYRIKVVPITVPPLRERKTDIPMLVAQFVETFNPEFGRQTKGFTRAAIELIVNYDWPGNIRELRNVVERAMILEEKEFLEAEDLPEEIRSPDSVTVAQNDLLLPHEGISLEEVERSFLQQALNRSQGNQSAAARLLGISRDTLRYRLKKRGDL